MKKSNLIISTDLSIEDAEDGAEIGPQSDVRALSFGAALHGQRVDRAVAELVPEFSRSYCQQLIESGAFQLNGQIVVKPSTRVKASDLGSVELRPTPQSQAFKPESMPLDVVYEDDHLLVLNKPAGLVVHPAPGNWSGTLLNGLLGRDPRAFELPRAGIVHRLDKDTSGLMVVARSRAAMDALVKLIAAREVSRQYLALAHRPWQGSAQRTIDAPIGRDPRNRLRMAVVDIGQHAGKPARTDVRLLDNGDLGCLLHCTLHTGRTHQIRVHLSSIGHPLVADETYGGAVAAGMRRQALHACRLAFIHPATAQALEFQAALPSDMQAGLAAWGLRYNRG